jgi:hypothetical protein
MYNNNIVWKGWPEARFKTPLMNAFPDFAHEAPWVAESFINGRKQL